MGTFDRMNFNAASAGSSVTEFPEETKNHMKAIPPQLNTWQKADLNNNDVGGYFQNPVGSVTTSIGTTANNISLLPHIGEVANLALVRSTANSLSLAASNFMGHTNRLSNLVEPNTNTTNLPHYNTASAQGKYLMYIFSETDGVQNTAPMMGHFTSLVCKDELTLGYSTVAGYPAYIQNHIIETVTDYPGDESNPAYSVTTYSTNLTPTMAGTLITEMTNLAAIMNTRRTNDVNFYNAGKTIIDQYNTLKQFSSMGVSQSDMMQIIGSDKLKSRLNS